MSSQITISNEHLSAVISTKGAELKSLKKDGKELLWEGNPEVWQGQAPVLFPICGGLKDDKYIYKNKEYILEKHGYARFAEFEIEKSDSESAVFLLCSNEESLKKYPFEYELRITYVLEGETVKIDYDVKNTGSDDMYFSIGSHEGYACPEGIEDYSVIFECTENLDSTVLDGNLLEYNTVCVGENTCELPLKYKYFDDDALVFITLKSRKATLKNRKTGDCITVDFNGADYFLLWTKPQAKYICLEPWCGIPDFVDSDYDFTKKRGIIKTEPGTVYNYQHKIIL